MAKDLNEEGAKTRFSSRSSECRRCIEILRSVLSKPDSRPAVLLEAISGASSAQTIVYNQEGGVAVTLSAEDTVERTEITPTRSQATGIIEKENDTDGTAISSLVRRWTQPREESTELMPTVNATSAKPLAASAATQRPSIDSMAIECRPCGQTGAEGGARAFVMGPKPLSIVLCTNRLHGLAGSSLTSAAAEVEEVLVHELTHVFDVRKLRLDLQDCQQLAYSEVRAAREAECKNFAWTVPQTYCVRQKARTATLNMFPQEGRACVENVIQRAMADRRPFAPHPEKDNGTNDQQCSTIPVQPTGSAASEHERQHFMPYPSER